MWTGRSRKTYGCKAVTAANLKFLTFDVNGETYYYGSPFCWDLIRRFEGLEEVRLVVWNGEQRKHELMDFFTTAMKRIAVANPAWIGPHVGVVDSVGKAWGRLRLGYGGEMQTQSAMKSAQRLRADLRNEPEGALSAFAVRP